MRKIKLFTVWLILFTSLFIRSYSQSRNLARALKVKPIENGKLFFVTPVIFDVSKNKNIKKTEADFTYLFYHYTNSDSIKMNFSVFSKDLIQKPYKIVFLKNQEVIWTTSEFEIFFVEKNKKFWETRLSTYLPLNYFFELLTEPQARISFCYGDDCVIFRMKKKYFAINRQIAKTIKIQTSQ